jgi:DNA excision repair protein ERCC-2
LPDTYACRNCGKVYSSEAYHRSRFCIECGTYLLPENKAARLFKRKQLVAKAKVSQRKDLLPENYQMRPGQMEFVREATGALKRKEVFVGSAPCGIGKSLASLLSVLPQLKENKLMICFRTRSQLHIYLKELKAVSGDIRAVSFFSKQDMCPLEVKNELSYVDFSEECGRLKGNCESSTQPFCKFYRNILTGKGEAEELGLDCAERLLSPSESVQYMSRRGYCAYEALKRILPKVNVFLGTYHYVFDPKIRESILKSFGVELSKVFLICDEAHNLPNFARELLSDKLTEGTVERALKETESYEHDSVEKVKTCLKVLLEEVFHHAHQALKNESLRRLNAQELSDMFLEHSSVNGVEAAATLQAYGEFVKEKRLESASESSSSNNHRIGVFLENFFKNVESKYMHLIERDRKDRIVLEVRSFDGREITDALLKEARGAILMSGFLSPPIVYRDLMLYPPNNACLKEFEPPFPPENRLILAAKDVSSEFRKRTDLMNGKWKSYLEAISEASQGNVAVFFTSYGMMHKVASMTKTGRTVIMEEPKTRRNDVINQLASSSNNLLYGVMGAKLSEGMDYPNNILKCVVTVGLPYATWDPYQESLIEYLEQQFPMNGRTYAYLTPAILRLVQACGRVHRSSEDRGCIVMLDERITQPHIRRQLPSYYQKEMITVGNPSDCAERIESFWNARA